jgi:hypothetical protein
MSRPVLGTLLLGVALVAGCSATEPRHVPKFYEWHANELATIAVYRFNDLTASALADTAKPGAGLKRMERLPGAGTAARDAVVDLLNGNERTRGLDDWEERASSDVAPPYRFQKKPRRCRKWPGGRWPRRSWSAR